MSEYVIQVRTLAEAIFPLLEIKFQIVFFCKGYFVLSKTEVI